MLFGLTRNQMIVAVLVIAIVLYYIYSRKMNNQKSSEPTPKPVDGKKHMKSHDNMYTFYNFYNPGCGWCKKLAPTWEKLTQAYASDPRIKIVGVDSSKPENDQILFYYNITAFPTLILVTPDRNLEYSGDRSIEDLDRFIRSNMK